MVEMAIVLMLTGLMTIGVASITQSAQTVSAENSDQKYLQSAEDAVYGYVLRNHHLPPPEGAVPSSGRPGFIQGWLPVASLGLPESARIRYLVDSSLTTLAVERYKADPLQLADTSIFSRTNANGLDFCMALLARQASGFALPDGLPVGFVLQPAPLSASTTDFSSPIILDGGYVEGGIAAPFTRASGYLGTAQRLGCFNRLSRLSEAVKTTANAVDMLKIARLMVNYGELQVKAAEESVIYLTWKKAVWVTGETIFTMDSILIPLQASHTLLGAASAGGNFASLVLVLGGTGTFINQTQHALDAAILSEAAAKVARDKAKDYRDSVTALVATSASRVNQLQEAGLQP